MTRDPYRPVIRRVSIDVSTLKALEQYLGDRPKTDAAALDLHGRIVALLVAQGLLSDQGDLGR